MDVPEDHRTRRRAERRQPNLSRHRMKESVASFVLAEKLDKQGRTETIGKRGVSHETKKDRQDRELLHDSA